MTSLKDKVNKNCALILKTGLCYGLGVGPVPFVAMSSLFPQVQAKLSFEYILQNIVSTTFMLCLCKSVTLKHFYQSYKTLGMGAGHVTRAVVVMTQLKVCL